MDMLLVWLFADTMVVPLLNKVADLPAKLGHIGKQQCNSVGETIAASCLLALELLEKLLFIN